VTAGGRELRTRKVNPRFSTFRIRHASINGIISQETNYLIRVNQVLFSRGVHVLQLIVGSKWVSQELKKIRGREFEKV
jgi:hypothetical protein